MPQASEFLRNKMGARFGDRISNEGPQSFLENRGYKLLGDWSWRLPSDGHAVTQEEYDCVKFLIEEWDFGGIRLGAGA